MVLDGLFLFYALLITLAFKKHLCSLAWPSTIFMQGCYCFQESCGTKFTILNGLISAIFLTIASWHPFLNIAYGSIFSYRFLAC